MSACVAYGSKRRKVDNGKSKRRMPQYIRTYLEQAGLTPTNDWRLGSKIAHDGTIVVLFTSKNTEHVALAAGGESQMIKCTLGPRWFSLPYTSHEQHIDVQEVSLAASARKNQWVFHWENDNREGMVAAPGVEFIPPFFLTRLMTMDRAINETSRLTVTGSAFFTEPSVAKMNQEFQYSDMVHDNEARFDVGRVSAVIHLGHGSKIDNETVVRLPYRLFMWLAEKYLGPPTPVPAMKVACVFLYGRLRDSCILHVLSYSTFNDLLAAIPFVSVPWELFVISVMRELRRNAIRARDRASPILQDGGTYGKDLWERPWDPPLGFDPYVGDSVISDDLW